MTISNRTKILFKIQNTSHGTPAYDKRGAEGVMSSVIQLSGFSGPGHFWSCSIVNIHLFTPHLRDIASSLAKA